MKESFALCCAMPLKLLKVDPQNESAWKLLLLVPILLLQRESREGQSGRKDIERFRLFKEERFGELSHLTKATRHKRSQGISNQETAQDMLLNPCLVRFVRSKIKSGEISTAASVLASSGVAEDLDDTLLIKKLEAKHLVRRSFSTSFQPHFPHSFQPLQISTKHALNHYEIALMGPAVGIIVGSLNI